ncbi:MAG: glycosyltransferase family 39 protein [Proteobacteria bacterium]|uniref:glycosyltransferase family 39 protein n=1 Tax=Aquabacterium sp. TaxID=1872578 RepID=UPI0035C69BED|nr:glycosyltransferase family 39 protein [Pseudomonadota bacterium]
MSTPSATPRLAPSPQTSAPLVLLTLLVGGYLLAWFALSPWGEFAINDDWSYATTARVLCETGRFVPHSWTSMPLLTHVAWGQLFCNPDAFSMGQLRLSTLVMGVLGGLGAWLLTRELGGSRWHALLATALLMLNPIHHGLSYSFMTDVPFTTWLTWTTWALAKAIRRDSAFCWVVGVLMTIACALSRQMALAPALAFAVVWGMTAPVRLTRLLMALTPLTACLLALWAIEAWMRHQDILPALYHDKSIEIRDNLRQPSALIKSMLGSASVFLLYLGLFLAPALLLVRSRPRRNVLLLVASLTGAAVMAVRFVASRKWMPVSGNVLLPHGLGPLTLPDTFLQGINLPPPLPTWIWMLATGIAVVGGLFLLWLVTSAAQSAIREQLQRHALPPQRRASHFVLLTCLAYMAPMLVGNGNLDRYTLPLLPLLAAWLLTQTATPSDGTDEPRASALGMSPSVVATGAVVMVALMGTFTLLASHDHIAWLKARHQAAQTLLAQGVLPQHMDAGFEFSGQHLYDDHYQRSAGKSWWWIQGDDHKVTNGPMDGYTSIGQVTYNTWLPPGQRAVHMLKRTP